jgi:mannosylglycoprotein endo-beta-mannosidase
MKVESRLLAFVFVLSSTLASTTQAQTLVEGWQMQDVAKVDAPAETVSTATFRPAEWYPATVPGTILTTLVNNKVYPEPLYGENMRQIPESLNKTSYWYRTSLKIPAEYKGQHVWLHFAGINYSAEIWVNGKSVGTMRGAFVRGDFDITGFTTAGRDAIVAVLVHPQPHPGIPHEHTVANGVGKNGGETALDGPTFLSTIGWDWLPAIRDRDTGIWLPVTLSATGPVTVGETFVTSKLAEGFASADLNVAAKLQNLSSSAVNGTLIGTIDGGPQQITFRKQLTLPASTSQAVSFDATSVPELHLTAPKLWWPNGYGPQNLYHLTLRFEAGMRPSDAERVQFGIRKIDYQVADSDNLTLSVNGVRVMVRGGNWGLDEAMKRVSRERLDAQFHMHALANLNLIRNWVGQSTSPDFYDMADKYGILLWDEFFQPNPSDGPDVSDVPTYLANVTDKVKHYRNHPAIAVWCARNEGYPPKTLDDTLRSLMGTLDPTRLYQSNSADGHGVSSHGPYYWRSPAHFYSITESFKTETGSVSVPTLESIQGMMPQKDWETINDDWAQHDMAKGAQRGDEYPAVLARRYGHIRNLADFARKGQMANYEAFRAMYEGRNAEMFRTTTGVITWMSHPAQPSFVWQLYHYDLEPNSALYAVKKAAETIHAQLNEATGALEVVNNTPAALQGLTLRKTIYEFSGKISEQTKYPVANVPASSTIKAAQIEVSARISALYFVKLDLTNASGALLSTNLYWQNVAQEDYSGLDALPVAKLDVTASKRNEADQTILDVTLTNNTQTVALMAHLQVHGDGTGSRILPALASDNYLSLVPGEHRELTITMPTKALGQQAPVVLIDGFNVGVNESAAPVAVKLNVNAQPMHWPATSLVP